LSAAAGTVNIAAPFDGSVTLVTSACVDVT
jgi:hypothetical protein